MTYLLLQQQNFLPSNCSYGAEIEYIGLPLYLSIDFSNFIYDSVVYKLSLDRILNSTGIHEVNAISGYKNRINAFFRTFYFDTISDDTNNLNIVDKIPDRLTIVQTKPVNPYKQQNFDFTYVTFRDMRFEPVLFDSNNH